jgi:threonine/homoserine/homoserine lactone efflux protein
VLHARAAVLLLVSLSLTRGASAGFQSSLGILTANALYFMISATSLGALLLASWELFTLVKWCGAAYLIWSGARKWFLESPLAARLERVGGALLVGAGAQLATTNWQTR